MSLDFRNIDVAPEAPVETWPGEAVLTALERGGLGDWRRLAAAIREQPWGAVARRVEEALKVSSPYGVAGLFERAIAQARQEAVRREREEVAAEVRACLEQSGLTAAEFADCIGTSASRFSTYLSGRVMPSAGLLLRMRRTAANAGRAATVPDSRTHA